MTKFQLEEIFQVSRCTTNGLNWDHAQVVEWTIILSYLTHRAGPIILNDGQNSVTMVLYDVSEYSSLSPVSTYAYFISKSLLFVDVSLI